MMDWLLLIATLPGQNSGLRVRFWRELKALGGASLRDGVYLLPWKEGLEGALTELRSDVLAADGSLYALRIPPPEPETQRRWMELFDRREAYAEWRNGLDRLLAALPDLAETDARRQLRQHRKALEAIVATDYFAGEAKERALRSWHDAEARVTRHYSPDEPLPAAGDIPRLDREAYQARRWATRQRLWVDRVASAWLIKRFIDPQANFVWLTDIRDCPKDALGFDFDGAAFTHVGDKVTFEVLLESFGLGTDIGLQRLAAMVHALDVGGEVMAEASGFEAILDGARNLTADDDQLLAQISGVLDSLYRHFHDNTDIKTTKGKPKRKEA